MIIQYGNVFEAVEGDRDSIIAIPANSRLKRGGELIMGAGAAKQAASMYPTLARQAGLAMSANLRGHDDYGFCFIPGTKFALFQSKTSPFEPSTLDMINKSIKKMLHVVNNKKVSKRHVFDIKASGLVDFKHLHLPLPGTGLGGLDPDIVIELFEQLIPEGDDRFILWRREDERPIDEGEDVGSDDASEGSDTEEGQEIPRKKKKKRVIITEVEL